MRIYSKILSIFAVTSALAFTLENNKVKRETENQCILGTAQFEDCFYNSDVNELCSAYNSERCQEYIKDPIASVPACQALSEEEQKQIKKDIYNKVSFNAAIASVSCAKNEKGEYCSYAASEDLKEAEKLAKVINDSATSENCAKNAKFALDYMVSDGANVDSKNNELAEVIKKGKETLESTQQCLAEIAEYQTECFQGNDTKKLCGNYNSKKCQDYLNGPMTVLTSCQSLSKEEQAKIRSEAFSNIIIDAGVAAVSCGKNENGEYCSNVPDLELSAEKKLEKAIEDSAESKACTENAIYALDYMIADGEQANNQNSEMVKIAEEGLKKLKGKVSYKSDNQQCLDEIAEYQAECFQGNDTKKLCGNYNSKKCQTYLANPMSVLTSCQSLPKEEQAKIRSEAFSNIIIDAGVAAVSCGKNENGEYCSNVPDLELSAEGKLEKAIKDSAESKACTENAIFALKYMIADGEQANNQNSEMVKIVEEGLNLLESEGSDAEVDVDVADEEDSAEDSDN